ncbi:L-arabinokinase-like isoform X1 [Euphorbia lathyris]|uniref:L-arabinokinase-like isoform X1 n=1 Tax=Euphorbia lathyris TaxID=212925 RepID=UPI0033133BDB
MVVLVFAMVCGVYICSTCLKQISTTSMIKIEDIQVIERPISVNQPDKHNVSSSGKIGYGTVSEALAYKLPFVFVQRDYFNEEPFLRNMLEYYQSGVEMIRRDLLTGHWQPYLECAISLKTCYEGGINGGEVYHFFLA